MNRKITKNLKSQVETILRQIPEARNSDITLTIEIWKRFHSDKLFIMTPAGMDEVSMRAVYLKSLYKLPREDNIKRIRAHFCQQGKTWAYPTRLEVALKRGIMEDKWRNALNCPIATEVSYPTKEGSYIEKIKIQKNLI